MLYVCRPIGPIGLSKEACCLTNQLENESQTFPIIGPKVLRQL
eukprot:COSAG04_NODE_21656_length_370_cov_0.568266_1_plen_42_part_10